MSDEASGLIQELTEMCVALFYQPMTTDEYTSGNQPDYQLYRLRFAL